VTPLEEVPVDARAEDDFGVAALDLVYTIGAGPEKVVPFERAGEPTAVSGRRMVYLEDLAVKPGDFVAYYARARDVSRGKRSSEARSDMFFLEVTPFEEEFVAAESQGGAGASGDSAALEELIQQQKDIVTATWNLDRRGREAAGRSDEDIRAVGRAQRDLRTRATATLTQMRRAADLRRRRPIGGRGGGQVQAQAAAQDAMVDAIARAIDAMARAQQQLDGLKTADALPLEMAALNELLRAQAEVRRREVQQQQANGTGGNGSNRQQQDLSSLFDRELAHQQETNYETPGGSETRDGDQKKDETLEKIRELARRQDALNQAQQQLAKAERQTAAEEMRRQLERLTREQTDLRRQAEELARQLQQQERQAQGTGQSRQSAGDGNREQQGGQDQQNGQRGQRAEGGRSGQGGQTEGGQRAQGGRGAQAGEPARGGQQASRALQEISREMQGAASGLRRDDAAEAAARGARAAERLRDLEQRLQGARGAGQDNAANGEDPGAKQLTDELSRIRELRESLAQLDRQLAELKAQGGMPGTQGQADRGGEGTAQAPWQEARELLNELRRENRVENLAREAEGFNPGRSAPGTEPWKQDFAKWDELKVHVAAALERAEQTAADRLRDRQSNDRLNTGAAQAAPDAYRRLVERYYRALAR
jgi:hypothetical protein